MRREYRLRRSADFDSVRAARASWAHPLLICSCRKREDSDPTRVGIIVGKRVGKSAVRNRVKRRIREAIRAYYPRLEFGHDIVFIARPAAVEASLAEISAAVHRLIDRAHLWRSSDENGSL